MTIRTIVRPSEAQHVTVYMPLRAWPLICDTRRWYTTFWRPIPFRFPALHQYRNHV